MFASPKSISTSKSINVFPDQLCKTAPQGDELIWLGESTFHRPPKALNPSPLKVSVKLFDHLAYGNSSCSTGRSSPPNQWDSPTDILFYHQRPSEHSPGRDTSECDSMATWTTQSYTATVHQVKIETLRRKEMAGLYQIQTVPGSQNMLGLFPYTPTIPAMKNSAESSTVKDGGDQDTKGSDLLVSVLDSPMTAGDIQETKNGTGLLANRVAITNRLRLKESHSTEADKDTRIVSYDRQPSHGFSEMQVDEKTTQTGEKDSMKALVERTGRAAKKARMANV
ncbi:hypothetical protein I306_05330 [Cryptococcus gattii EJB2]|uniref:Uncharacterized protein n=1 Tax=Cryptococcus gattii EJB2 TaxID=1296103 RepID=A0ABR5BPM4_9TREE|nr:hypothetical protein I306_05330 [Cryptococcus gattii EJB2]